MNIFDIQTSSNVPMPKTTKPKIDKKIDIITEFWRDNYIEFWKEDICPVCTLCGNTGIIDTTNSAFNNNRSVGRKNFCICPNGQELLTSLKEYWGKDMIEKLKKRKYNLEKEKDNGSI